jgi:hypothetical protein
MARDFMGRPDRHRHNVISSRIASGAGAARSAPREIKPEPVYISPRRLDALEAAAETAIRSEAAILEYAEFMQERAGRCQRNERREDGSWHLCDEPAWNGTVFCEKHYTRPNGGGVLSLPSVESTTTAPAPVPFEESDPVMAALHPRVGHLYPVAVARERPEPLPPMPPPTGRARPHDLVRSGRTSKPREWLSEYVANPLPEPPLPEPTPRGYVLSMPPVDKLQNPVEQEIALTQAAQEAKKQHRRDQVAAAARRYRRRKSA